MIDVPQAFLEAVDRVARAALGRADVEGAALGAQVARLSALYTREREALGAAGAAAERETRAARLRFFLPRDLPKIGGPLLELARAGALPRGEAGRWRVLDVGAGMGASSLGAARFAHLTGAARGLEVVAVDRDAGALDVLGRLAREGTAAGLTDVSVRARVGDLSLARAEAGPFDLILLGFVLNELPLDVGGRAELLAALAERLAEDGALIVLEPALRETSRQLHRVRDRIAATAGAPHLFAPCLRRGPCPMLETERDWCHEDLPAALPAPLAPIARAAGLRFERLTYGYLVLRKDERSLRGLLPAAPGTEAYRVVSQPMPTKGKRELFGCGDPGRVRLVRLDRHRTEANAAFDALLRGDLLRIAPGAPDHRPPDDRGRWRIGPADRVSRGGRDH